MTGWHRCKHPRRVCLVRGHHSSKDVTSGCALRMLRVKWEPLCSVSTNASPDDGADIAGAL
jgi:hypothetical protein